MKLPKYEWVLLKTLHDTYPGVSRDQAFTYQISPTGIHAATGEILWRFSSRDDHWSVVVGEAAITLESRGYISMRDFLEHFTVILEAAKETLGVKDRLRQCGITTM